MSDIFGTDRGITIENSRIVAILIGHVADLRTETEK